MLRNFILSSLRSLRKKPGFTLVNILGLSLGMATCLAIFLFVQYDLSYDDFQDDQVYRIWLNRVYPEREVDYAFIPHSLGPQIKLDFPEVAQQARLFKIFASTNVRYEDDSYNEEDVIFADSTVFEVLTIPLKKGDPTTALKGNDAVVLSESTAKKLFVDEEAIGKTLEFPQGPKKVTAVAYDYPNNSHINFDYIVPLLSLPFFNQPNWLGFSAFTYLKLNDGVNPREVEDKIPQMIQQYAAGEMKARQGISYEEYIEAGNGYNYHLQSIRDIHLHSHLEGELSPNGNINYVYIFSIVAVFILVIACINFMNLSTARSTERGKEVGIRKVLGSKRKQLIGQFLTESVIITVLAALVSVFLTSVFIPTFSTIADRPLSLQQLFSPGILVIGSLIILLIGFLAGAYPAFIISSFRPVSVLKGKLNTSQSGVGLRNTLVILQFAISIALISATLIVNDQMNFLLSKPLGFEKENILVIENSFVLNNNEANLQFSRFKTFQNELKTLPNVNEVSFTSAMPGDMLPGYIVRISGSTEKESMVTRSIYFEDKIPEALNIELVKGRFFSPDFNDSLSMILNESAVQKLGLEDPVGKKIENVINNGENIQYTIIGVVKDFHFQSLHTSMEPAAILSMESQGAFVNKTVVNIAPGNYTATVSSIERVWNEFVPEAPFESYFLDNDLKKFYESEKATGNIFLIFTILAIIIASIGLLGL